MTVKTTPQILTEIGTQFPDNTTAQITPAILRSVTQDMTNFSGYTVTSIMSYASGTSLAGGTADVFPAFNTAFSALGSIGGGLLYVPPGTYNFISGACTPPNNVILQGAGIDSTFLKNTALFPNNTTIQIPFTLTGANTWPNGTNTYGINAPTLGGTQVITTTAANSANFNPGDIIFVSGTTHGTSFWYPGWVTTVNGTTTGGGVISLAETLPLGGTQLTTVQKVVSLPTNICVRDMTIISGTTAAIECQGGKNFVFENLKIIPGSGGVSTADVTFGIHKNSTFRHIIMEQGAQPLELFVSNNCTIDDCHITDGYILVDGGSFDCVVTNSTVKDPMQNNGTALQSFHGIHIPDYTSRIRVIGNNVTGIPNAFAGINIAAVPDSNRDHILVGNTLVGGSGGNATGINTSNGLVVGNFFYNLQNAIQMQPTEVPIIEGNYFDTCSNNIAPFSGTGAFRTVQNGNLRAMQGGVGTPTVQGWGSYTLQQGGAQNVTNFTGAQGGDMIWVATKDGSTTFVSGSGITMKNGANYNAPNNTVLCFLALSGTTWIEVSRTQ